MVLRQMPAIRCSTNYITPIGRLGGLNGHKKWDTAGTVLRTAGYGQDRYERYKVYGYSRIAYTSP